MKNVKRLLCLLLVLASMATLLPVFAAADSDKKTITVTIKKTVPSQKTTRETVEVGAKDLKLKHDRYITVNKKVYEFSHYKVSGDTYSSLTIPGYNGKESWEKKWKNTIEVVYKSHTHQNKKSHDRIYHWDTCVCGLVGTKTLHVDPLTATDKSCYCGYVFSSNANLTTLWLANMTLSPCFSPDTTDYIGELVTYMDVDATTISVQAFDSLATIAVPTDLAIREGSNKFQITITAEDRVTQKTYTVTAVKPVAVEGTRIFAADGTLSLTADFLPGWDTASITLSEAAQQKLAEMIGTETASQLLFLPQGDKWGSLFLELTLPANVLKAIAEKATMDLVVQTAYGSVLTVPAAQIPALAEKESVTFRIGRDDKSLSIRAGEESLTVPETITLVIPE